MEQFPAAKLITKPIDIESELWPKAFLTVTNRVVQLDTPEKYALMTLSPPTGGVRASDYATLTDEDKKVWADKLDVVNSSRPDDKKIKDVKEFLRAFQEEADQAVRTILKEQHHSQYPNKSCLGLYGWGPAVGDLLFHEKSTLITYSPEAFKNRVKDYGSFLEGKDAAEKAEKQRKVNDALKF